MHVLLRPEEGTRCPGAGVTGGCEPASIGVGNPPLVLCKICTSRWHGAVSSALTPFVEIIIRLFRLRFLFTL